MLSIAPCRTSKHALAYPARYLSLLSPGVEAVEHEGALDEVVHWTPAIEIRARQDPRVPLVGRVWRLTAGSTVAELRPFVAGGFPLLRCGERRVHSVQLRQRRFFLRTTFPQKPIGKVLALADSGWGVGVE